MKILAIFGLVVLTLTTQGVVGNNSEKCDAILVRVMRTAAAVFTGKVEALNGTRGEDREALVQVKRVFRKPKLPEDNDAGNSNSGFLSKLNVVVPPVTSVLNDEFLVCMGIFSPLYSLRVRDTKLFIVKFQERAGHGQLIRQKDNSVPKFELLTCPLPMSVTNLNRITLAVQGMLHLHMYHTLKVQGHTVNLNVF